VQARGPGLFAQRVDHPARGLLPFAEHNASRTSPGRRTGAWIRSDERKALSDAAVQSHLRFRATTSVRG
jgi:hypothetical protein